MKLSIVNLVLSASMLLQQSAVTAMDRTESNDLKEEEFWNRFLATDSSMSLPPAFPPTNPPVAAPTTTAPQPAPITPPIIPPMAPPTMAPLPILTGAPQPLPTPPPQPLPTPPPQSLPTFPPQPLPTALPPQPLPTTVPPQPLPTTLPPQPLPTTLPPQPLPTLPPAPVPTLAPQPLPTLIPAPVSTTAPSKMKMGMTPTLSTSAPSKMKAPNSTPSFSTNVPSKMKSPSKAPEPCIVEVTIDCVTSNGLPCEDFPAPPTSCIDDVGLLSLTFQYLNFTCAQSSNNQGNNTLCNDFEQLNETSRVECIDERGQPLTVLNPTISFGQFFTVQNPNGNLLPNQTDCVVVNANNVKVQQNVIDTSGRSPLSPGDRFGALQLTTCGNTDCLETIRYIINVTNGSPDVLTLTRLDFTFQDEEPLDLLTVLDSTEIEEEETTTIVPELEINICSGGDFVASVIAEAEVEEGGVCVSSDTSVFDGIL